MSNHSDVLKDARELADDLCVKDLPSSWDRDAQAATVLRTLADIVEAYDKQPTLDENLKDLRADIDALGRRVSQRDDNAEPLTACRTCDEVIARYLSTPTNQSGPGSVAWIQLKVTGLLAKRAAENWDRLSEGCVKASLVAGAVAQIESGDNDFVDADEFKAKGGA